MELISTPRVEFLRGLVGEILGHYRRGRTIVAIDGLSGLSGIAASGRAAFADDLAKTFEEREHPAFRASLRNFQRSRADQERFGPDTPERRYRHGHDYSALRRVLIEPFRLDGSAGFVTEVYDPDRDAWIEPTWRTAAADAVLIVDGDFLNRPELRGLWSYSILLEAPAAADAERFDAPDAAATDADALYRAEAHPREQASALVDVTDPAAPSRLFLDSC